LVEEWVGPVMSPQYWQQVKQDISAMKLLHSETRPKAWRLWSKATSQESLLNNEQQSFAHFYFALQASVDGLGATMGSYPLVVDDLQRGNLIAPFGFIQSGHHYVALTEADNSGELESGFIQWLISELKGCVPKF
jgi:DNA-binding transcriptional LysR family regulator